MPILIRGEKYYLVKDLEKILPLTKNTIRMYIRKGRIRGKKLGKLFYVSNTDLRGFLDRRGEYEDEKQSLKGAIR
ncbi:unnamed protein product [marine sediment metagenome]|uniref:Helix-turn-helix domain-containing protein n=1 Tax=marine sediment metagenome TaxID=412755 RepID=X1L9J4_9ZZZZ